ncbi:MAG: hypothetical protein E6Q97_02475, partial [Desulfurellales bacterium]
MTEQEQPAATPPPRWDLMFAIFGRQEARYMLRAYKRWGCGHCPNTCTQWRYQWLVNGHWRAQWYPKSQEHRTIWIMPHMKGPEDKPVKPATERVF